MTAKISLIITVYNRDRYLSSALESVLAQTKTDFELLIWDDGSTDNSVTIAKQYAKDDERVKVVEGVHQGITRSLKAAIAHTTGHYLGWVDSDDLLEPTALEETSAVLDVRPEVGLVYTDYIDIDANGRVLDHGKRCRIPYSKERLLLDFMTFHFRLIRRSVFNQVGGIDESFECAQDYDLCLKLSEVTKVQHIKKPLYLYRHHAESNSQQRQLEQIYCSRDAIDRALKRRGLDDRFEINLRIVGRFSLRKKHSVDRKRGKDVELSREVTFPTRLQNRT